MGRALLPILLIIMTSAAFFLIYNSISMLASRHIASSSEQLPNLAEDERTTESFLRAVMRKPKKLILPEQGVSDNQQSKRRPFHVALTVAGGEYSRWQTRILYYWYMQFRDKPGSEMGGFSRILHSGEPDDLMDEIPTFVAEMLPPGLDKGYVVLNRPWAFLQWLHSANIEEDYILMAEPDHIFLKPLPNLATEELPAAFPFFYIKPMEHKATIRKFFPENLGPVSVIDPIGNSPAIIKKSDLKKIAPTWMNISLQMKNDPEADEAFGWVLEMYAYAVASAAHGIKHILRNDFMVQPPWDVDAEDKYIMHYTYPLDYTLKGDLIYGKDGEWSFDKRKYIKFSPPKKLSLPPPTVPKSVVTLINKLNEAMDNIPNWEHREEE